MRLSLILLCALLASPLLARSPKAFFAASLYEIRRAHSETEVVQHWEKTWKGTCEKRSDGSGSLCQLRPASVAGITSAFLTVSEDGREADILVDYSSSQHDHWAGRTAARGTRDLPASEGQIVCRGPLFAPKATLPLSQRVTFAPSPLVVSERATWNGLEIRITCSYVGRNPTLIIALGSVIPSVPEEAYRRSARLLRELAPFTRPALGLASMAETLERQIKQEPSRLGRALPFSGGQFEVAPEPGTGTLAVKAHWVTRRLAGEPGRH